MGTVIRFKNVGFRYGDNPWELRDISFRVRERELLGILGANGSGKTTLLKLGSGLLRHKAGEILLKGRPLSSYSRMELSREIAMVPQETHFHFAFTVMEVVLMGRFPYLGKFQFEGKRDMEIAREALRATGSLDLANRSIHELSGGERQRVVIARALAQEPSLMLLDEPTAFLDLKFKKEIFELIASLVHSRGISVLVVSHDIDLTAKYCSRIGMLKDGEMVFIGDPKEVITSEGVEYVYECPVVVDENPVTGAPRVSVV